MIHLPEKQIRREQIRRELSSWVAVAGSVAILALFSPRAFAQEQAPKAPASRQDNFREVIHGIEIVDPYRWLEDQDSPETRQWTDAQNQYSHSLLDTLPVRPFIQKRLTELLRIDTVSTPLEQGGRYFLFKKRAEDDLSILYVRKGLNSQDEVLLDPHTLSPDHTTSIDLEDVSGDGRRMVYSIRRGGEDETELRVMDVDSRQDLSDRLPRALYRGASFKEDGSGFYYNLQKRDVGARIFYQRARQCYGRSPKCPSSPTTSRCDRSGTLPKTAPRFPCSWSAKRA